MSKPIPVFKPQLYGEPKRLLETLRSTWWGTGPRVAEFEAVFAAYIGVAPERCIMLNSCTAALHLAVKLYPDAQRVLVPSLTFVASALPAFYEGKQLVFVEVGDDLCVDPDDVLRKLESEADILMAVHLGGQVANLERIRPRCRVIEDCAPALGSFDGTRHVGTQAPGCFSFHALKPLPIGDGGMLVLTSPDQRPSVAALAWYGIDKTTWDRMGPTYRWEYMVDAIGYKYRANDVIAALALDQWGGLIPAYQHRQTIAKRYFDQLGNLEWLRLPQVRAGTTPNWLEFTIRTPYRDELSRHLADLGIVTTVHCYPMHLYPALWTDGKPQSLPRTEVIGNEILTIPCFTGMTDEEQQRVVDGIRLFRP